MVFFANLYDNLRGSLCDVLKYASAQPLDFLDLGKKIHSSEWETPNSFFLKTRTLNYALFQKSFIHGFHIDARLLKSLAAEPHVRFQNITLSFMNNYVNSYIVELAPSGGGDRQVHGIRRHGMKVYGPSARDVR